MSFKVKEPQRGDIHFGEFTHYIIHEQSGHILTGIRSNGDVVTAYGVTVSQEDVKTLFSKYFNGDLPELSEDYVVPALDEERPSFGFSYDSFEDEIDNTFGDF